MMARRTIERSGGIGRLQSASRIPKFVGSGNRSGQEVECAFGYQVVSYPVTEVFGCR